MTEYFEIKDPRLKEKVNSRIKGGGIYILHLFAEDKPQKIARAFGIDPDGILYIGKNEDDLSDRVSSLKKSIEANLDHHLTEPIEKGHKTLSKKYFRIRKRVDFNKLKVSIYSINDTPKNDEQRALEEYVSNYGELPPLNGNYGSGNKTYWEKF